MLVFVCRTGAQEAETVGTLQRKVGGTASSAPAGQNAAVLENKCNLVQAMYRNNKQD